MNGNGFDYLSNKKSLYGGSGGGGASSGGGKFIGYVKNGDTNFPSEAEKNDFVKVDASNTVFPFTIQNITFSNKNDQAIYTGSQWILYSFIVETKNIEVSNPQQESLTNKTLQSQINTENKEKFEEIDERLKKMYKFIGFISTTEPTGQIENNIYWYNSSILPTTFPIQVKVYSNGAWSTETIDYTPANFDTWSNKNDDKGYYWFANNWNINDANILTDDITIEINNNGEIQLKNNGITFLKLNANLYNNQVANENDKIPLNEAVFKEILNNTNSNFTKSYSNNNLDLMINLKNNNNTSKIDKTTTLLTKISDYTSLTDTDKLSFLDITTQELKDVALSAINSYIQSKLTGAISTTLTNNLTANRLVETNSNGKLTTNSNNITANTTNGLKSFTVSEKGLITSYTVKSLGRGLNDSSNTIGHSNTAITNKTNTNIVGVSYDAYGHITGKGTEYTASTSISSSSTNTQLATAKAVNDALSTGQTQLTHFTPTISNLTWGSDVWTLLDTQGIKIKQGNYSTVDILIVFQMKSGSFSAGQIVPKIFRMTNIPVALSYNVRMGEIRLFNTEIKPPVGTAFVLIDTNGYVNMSSNANWGFNTSWKMAIQFHYLSN